MEVLVRKGSNTVQFGHHRSAKVLGYNVVGIHKPAERNGKSATESANGNLKRNDYLLSSGFALPFRKNRLVCNLVESDPSYYYYVVLV